MTTGLIDRLKNEGNKDDLIAFRSDIMLPVDDVEASNIANELLEHPR